MEVSMKKKTVKNNPQMSMFRIIMKLLWIRGYREQYMTFYKAHKNAWETKQY